MGKFDDVNVSSLINDLSNILDDVNTRKHRLDFINESITSNIWSSESRNNFERGIISLKNKLGELEPILQNYLGIAGKIEQYKDIEFETEAKQMEYNSIETSREVCLVSYDDEGNPHTEWVWQEDPNEVARKNRLMNEIELNNIKMDRIYDDIFYSVYTR